MKNKINKKLVGLFTLVCIMLTFSILPLQAATVNAKAQNTTEVSNDFPNAGYTETTLTLKPSSDMQAARLEPFILTTIASISDVNEQIAYSGGLVSIYPWLTAKCTMRLFRMSSVGGSMSLIKSMPAVNSVNQTVMSTPSWTYSAYAGFWQSRNDTLVTYDPALVYPSEVNTFAYSQILEY